MNICLDLENSSFVWKRWRSHGAKQWVLLSSVPVCFVMQLDWLSCCDRTVCCTGSVGVVIYSLRGCRFTIFYALRVKTDDFICLCLAIVLLEPYLYILKVHFISQMFSKMGAHYHCIVCSATITRRTDMIGHINRHVNKGETESRFITGKFSLLKDILYFCSMGYVWYLDDRHEKTS